jgi:hypothetical protein
MGYVRATILEKEIDGRRVSDLPPETLTVRLALSSLFVPLRSVKLTRRVCSLMRGYTGGGGTHLTRLTGYRVGGTQRRSRRG